jgi:hypothetical protein
MGQNYHFREQMVSFRLNQVYYVTPYTLRDFREEPRLKKELDIKIEEEIMHNLDA